MKFPQDLFLKTAYLIFATMFSVLVAFAVLFALGLNPNFTHVNMTYAQVGYETAPVDFASFPLKMVAVFGFIFPPFYLVMLVISFLQALFIPAGYVLTHQLIERLIQVGYGVGFLLVVTFAYAVMFTDDVTTQEIMRRLGLIFYNFYQANAGLLVAIIGAVLSYEGSLLPRWLSNLLLVGGISSLGVSLLGTNVTLPINRLGLLFLPYCIALTILASYLVIASQPTPADHETIYVE